MSKFPYTGKDGFTLVEALVYTALLGLLMTGLVSLVLSVSGLYVKARSLEEVLYSSRRIEKVLAYYIGEEAIGIISPVSGASEGRIVLRLPGGREASFYSEGGKVYLDDGTTEATPITSDEVLVSDFSVRNYSSIQGPDSVSVTCKISFANIESMEYRSEFYLDFTVNTVN